MYLIKQKHNEFYWFSSEDSNSSFTSIVENATRIKSETEAVQIARALGVLHLVNIIKLAEERNHELRNS